MERARAPGTDCIIAAVAILALGGCALTIAGPAKDRPRNKWPACDTSKAFVVTDALLGSVAGVTALGVLGSDDAEVALLPGVISAAFILSAISGNGRANDCRAAIAEYEGEQERRPLPDEDDTAAARSAALRGPPGGEALALPTAGRVRAGAGAASTSPAAVAQPRAAAPMGVDGREPAGVAPRAGASARAGRKPAAVTPRRTAAPSVAAPSPAAPPDAVPPDAAPPDAAPPDAAPPAVAPPSATPPAASPSPSPRKPPSPPAPTPRPPPAAPPPDRWTDFWKELP